MHGPQTRSVRRTQPGGLHYNYHCKLDGRPGDETIEEKVRELLGDVCALLKEHGEIAFCEIAVTASEGVVTLQGNAGSLQIKRTAENIARSVAGVKEVSNRLRVKKCRRDHSQPRRIRRIAIVPPSLDYAIT